MNRRDRAIAVIPPSKPKLGFLGTPGIAHDRKGKNLYRGFSRINADHEEIGTFWSSRNLKNNFTAEMQRDRVIARDRVIW